MNTLIYMLFFIFLISFILFWIAGIALCILNKKELKIYKLTDSKKRGFGKIYHKFFEDFRFTIMLLKRDFKDINPQLRNKIIMMSNICRMMLLSFIGLIISLFFVFQLYNK